MTTTLLSPAAPAADRAGDAAAAPVVDAARAALVEEVGRADVGGHLDAVVEDHQGDALVVSHRFACERKGYVGWHWSVTVVVIPDAPVTIDEVVLLPGADAIVAPAWVPYRERIRPGDLSPGDLLPVADDDPRLVPTYSYGDDPIDAPLGADAKAQVRQVADELGLGRVRTLGPVGLEMAAERWYSGANGPTAPVAQAAPDHCYSCGFLLRINGSLSLSFGVCANGDANDDGRVVSMDHGCGAHSEVRLAKKYEPLPVPEPVFDTLTVDEVEAL